MAKKKTNYMFILGILITILIIITTMKNLNSNEYFTNLKENFETMREQNSCGTCKVRNQN